MRAAVVRGAILGMVSSGEDGPDGAEQVSDELTGGRAGDALEMIAELRVSLRELTSQLVREHDRAQARETVIDRLHAGGFRVGRNGVLVLLPEHAQTAYVEVHSVLVRCP